MVDSLFYYGLHLLIAKDLSGNLVAAFVWVTSGITLMNEKRGATVEVGCKTACRCKLSVGRRKQIK